MRPANAAPGAAAPILPNVRITADVVNNNLLIYANQESYGIIKRALEQIDRPPAASGDRCHHRGGHTQ